MKADVNLIKAIEEEKKGNFKSNLKFVLFYADWLKHTSNKIWSEQQALLINSQLLGADQDRARYLTVKAAGKRARAAQDISAVMEYLIFSSSPFLGLSWLKFMMGINDGFDIRLLSNTPNRALNSPIH